MMMSLILHIGLSIASVILGDTAHLQFLASDSSDRNSWAEFELAEEKESKKTELFSFNETTGSEVEKSEWKLELFDEEILAYKKAPREHAVARYNAKWELEEFHFKGPDQKFEMKMGADRQIQAKNLKNGKERTVRLENNYPWIQQPTVGLRNFILNKGEKTLHFYMLRPDTLEPVEVVATKVEEKGQTTALEIRPLDFFIGLAFQADTWHDTNSGLATKIIEKRTEGFSLPRTTVIELIENPKEIVLSPI